MRGSMPKNVSITAHRGPEQLQAKKETCRGRSTNSSVCVCEREALYSNNGKRRQSQHIPHCGLGLHKWRGSVNGKNEYCFSIQRW